MIEGWSLLKPAYLDFCLFLNSITIDAATEKESNFLLGFHKIKRGKKFNYTGLISSETGLSWLTSFLNTNYYGCCHWKKIKFLVLVSWNKARQMMQWYRADPFWYRPILTHVFSWTCSFRCSSGLMSSTSQRLDSRLSRRQTATISTVGVIKLFYLRRWRWRRRK